MRQPSVDDQVRLTQDIPELWLTKGECGVVRSTWFAPSVAYEVEFQIGRDWWFLNYVEFQVGDDKPFDYQVLAAIVKAW